MTIRNIREAEHLKRQGTRLGRDGMSQRVERLVLEFIQEGGGYKNAMILAGRMKAIATAARCDDYWTEQVDKGWTRETCDLLTFDSKMPHHDHDFETIKGLSDPSKEFARLLKIEDMSRALDNCIAEFGPYDPSACSEYFQHLSDVLDANPRENG